MKQLSVTSSILTFATTSIAFGQMPQPSVPDNLLNSTNTIGLPAAASKDGDREVVNLNNGSVTFFLPALTLPQRTGAAPLTIGFTYDSNQTNIQQTVSANVAAVSDTLGACDQGCVQFMDTLYYTVGTASITTSGLPIDWNIPQLIGSLEYEGDWVNYSYLVPQAGPRVCLTNMGFRDWNGTLHMFPQAQIACSYLSEGGSIIVSDDVSADNLGYYLDATHTQDIIVYSPDGTAYHFLNALPYPSNAGGNDLGGFSNSAEQFLHTGMTYSLDKFGNRIGFGPSTYWPGQGALKDTLGREISLQNDPVNGAPSIRYKDANGNDQTVSVQLGLSAADSVIPQSSGFDTGMYFGGRLGNQCVGAQPQYNPPQPQIFLGWRACLLIGCPPCKVRLESLREWLSTSLAQASPISCCLIRLGI